MSFKDYILNVHPDPDFLGSKTVYDAYDELDRLAQNYAKDQNERLTKEVEEWKSKYESSIERNIDKAQEITRLRELGKQIYNEIFIKTEEGDRIFPDQIDFGKITDLLNALNHKP